ncbi:T-cell surface antigen CD2-like [Hyperolius riggenbachi]|uniref:T-cell surface antigen CD2-like n=1 Tax=Hyperolius riggenbachi TaxID=752182 RepID=UPI0035A33117
MEERGAQRLSLWTWLGLFLLFISGGDTEPAIYAAVGEPVQLSIPDCAVSGTDLMEWRDQDKRLIIKVGKMSEAEKAPGQKVCNCKLYSNGSLLLNSVAEGRSSYSVELHSREGGHRKCGTPRNITVQGGYRVDAPFINFTCTNKRAAEVNCYISRGTDPELLLIQGDKEIGKTKEKSLTSIQVNAKETTNITCSAKNNWGSNQASLEVVCEEIKKEDQWNWYLYLAAAAGGVAFIIFIILIVYSIRSCKRPVRLPTDEDGAYNNQQMRPHPQQRTLPQPPIQAAAVEQQYRQVAPQPEGRKTRRSKQRQAPPPQESQNSDLQPNQSAAQTRPALPGNHPSNQPPRPQPRTKSKAPRQHRKSR